MFAIAYLSREFIAFESLNFIATPYTLSKLYTSISLNPTAAVHAYYYVGKINGRDNNICYRIGIKNVRFIIIICTRTIFIIFSYVYITRTHDLFDIDIHIAVRCACTGWSIGGIVSFFRRIVYLFIFRLSYLRSDVLNLYPYTVAYLRGRPDGTSPNGCTLMRLLVDFFLSGIIMNELWLEFGFRRHSLFF